MFQAPGAYHLYYLGYLDKGIPAALCLATSTDGINVGQRVETILEPTVEWYDNDTIYNPSIFQTGGQFLVICASHRCTNG